ncbi:DNA-binding response regulator [candidate division Kazan bacterium]|uniref:DNA-binding response regulator n=1 Tax=candidate division Kazan bacterium TaxID=2202143 RepID=A0A420ZCB1_UNCK3|nr:MAG: DNA-binding response regulator [candidate division Kazan bacterium]
MERVTILVVEDEEDILELVRYNLAKEGYQVIKARSGERALQLATSEVPDLVLLDLMLPGVDGIEVCRRIKGNSATQHIPVIMLTAKSEETDIVVGLELGADDYITKPFSPRVLLARIKAVLRRRIHQDVDDQIDTIHYADLVISPDRFEVMLGDRQVDLTATEFRILLLLVRRPGWVFTRSQIVDAARGEDYPVTDRSVDVHIASLRKKLGSSGYLIETVRGVGYRLKAQP